MIEFIVGRELPNSNRIAEYATQDGASKNEIDISVYAKRREFLGSLVTAQGLRQHISDVADDLSAISRHSVGFEDSKDDIKEK